MGGGLPTTAVKSAWRFLLAKYTIVISSLVLSPGPGCCWGVVGGLLVGWCLQDLDSPTGFDLLNPGCTLTLYTAGCAFFDRTYIRAKLGNGGFQCQQELGYGVDSIKSCGLSLYPQRLCVRVCMPYLLLKFIAHAQ